MSAQAVTYNKEFFDIMSRKLYALYALVDGFPEGFTENQKKIVREKYFRHNLYTGAKDKDFVEVVSRVMAPIDEWLVRNMGYTTAANEIAFAIMERKFAFNSPVWFNLGSTKTPQCSACFILDVEDNMESILNWNTEEGMIFKGGSGSGVNLSKIRADGEKLTNGGVASGPVSFMRGADSWAGTIKSGGSTRRAAKMVILDADHPDIYDFIDCKVKEEEKLEILAKNGVDVGLNSHAYKTAQYQNANNSVRVTDEFMEAVENDGEWELKGRHDDSVNKVVKARDLFRKICEAAHKTGDPGMQFHDTINRANVLDEEIVASNPCSEYMHINNSACNLASINVGETGSFTKSGMAEFGEIVKAAITCMDAIVDISSYPTKKIEKNTKKYRPLGLGLTNISVYLENEGLPYDDSNDTMYVVDELFSRLHEAAYSASRDIQIKAINNGLDTGSNINPEVYRRQLPKNHELYLNPQKPRNSQLTVMAPTGTISFMMGCDSTGIEPTYSPIQYKTLVGGGLLKTVAGSIERYAEKELGESKDVLVDLIVETGKIRESVEAVRELGYDLSDDWKDLRFAVCEDEELIVTPRQHVDIMAAAQKYLSGAISKTVNMPETATVEDIEEIYTHAWRSGVKAIAVYRDNCKQTQVLTTKKKIKQLENELFPTKDKTDNTTSREILPDERPSITHKFVIGQTKGYLTVGLKDSGEVGEIFLTGVGKDGSTLAGMLNSFCTAVSIGLQYGVPLSKFIEKFSWVKFEPYGATRNENVRFAQSIPDYIFRWIEAKQFKTIKVESTNQEKEQPLPDEEKQAPHGEMCTQCGVALVRAGTCNVCPMCGSTTGCS